MEYDEEILSILAKAASMQPKQAEEVDYHKFIVDITKDFAEPEPIVSQGDRILVSRGNLCTITGKAKSYKTFFVSAAVAAFLEDETLSLSGPGGMCLYIDTEQAAAHVNKVQRRIYRLCGWDFDKPSSKLITLSLRELSVKNRLKTTIAAIDDMHPDLVIIDGIRDLVNDFNNVEESTRIVGKLMALSTQQNCAIITILHQNKADENARGHLGSEICNKSETVLTSMTRWSYRNRAGSPPSRRPLPCRNLPPTLRKLHRHRSRKPRNSRNRKSRSRNQFSQKTRIISTLYWPIRRRSQTHGRTSSV